MKKQTLITLTSENDQEFTKNPIYTQTYDDYLAHLIWANNYIFFMDFGRNKQIIKEFEEIRMKDEQLVKVGIVPNYVWNDFRKNLILLKLNEIKTPSQL